MSLEDLSEQELTDKLKELENEKIRRKNKQIEKRNVELREHQQAVFVNADSLLACVTHHCRSSCDDKKLNNRGDCVRCTLLDMKNIGCNYDNISITILIEKREPENRIEYRR